MQKKKLFWFQRKAFREQFFPFSPYSNLCRTVCAYDYVMILRYGRWPECLLVCQKVYDLKLVDPSSIGLLFFIVLAYFLLFCCV